jgi:hypothetical protein
VSHFLDQKKTDRFDGWLSGCCAVFFSLMAVALSVWQEAAGLWNVFVSASVLIRGIIPAVFLVCLAIIWTAVIFGVLPRVIRSRRSRIISSIFPFIVLATTATFRVAKNPPSPNEYFRFYFECSLPINAENIRVRPETLNDRDDVGVYFTTTSEETQKLISTLALEQIDSEISDSWEYFFRVPGILDPPPAAGFIFFEHNKLDGSGIILATNPERTQVFMAYQPLWNKAIND